MTRIELVSVLPAPVERAFDLAREVGVHERSLAGHGERAVGGRTTGLVGPGETVTFEGRYLRVHWRLTSRVSVVGWDPPRAFVDEQVRGPFLWFRHEHRFEAVEGGTRMVDLWEHRLRWGLVGSVVDLLVVRRTVRSLLRERATALARLATDEG